MDKLTKLITKADFVGIQLKPTLNGTNRLQSFFGGLISVSAAVSILLGFVYFGISMIKKDKPIMNVVQRMESDAIIKMKDNPILIAVFDSLGRVISHDPGFRRAVEIELQLYRVKVDPVTHYSIEIFKGKSKVCEETDVSEKVYQELKSIGKHPESRVICIDYSSFVNSKGEAYQGEMYYRNVFADIPSDYLYFKFKHCDEKADPGCGNYLTETGRININIYRMDYYIDQTDFENPVKPNMDQIGFSPNKIVGQTVYVQTRINEIVTDKSMFLTEETKEIYYSALNPTVNIRPYEEKERLLLEFVVSCNKIVVVNQRRYLKIPELLANMGGFMKAAMAIGNLLAYLNSDFIYYLTVRKVELKYSKKYEPAANIAESGANTKSSITPIRLNNKEVPLPSFSEYVFALLSSKKGKSISRKETFKYLELNYMIERFIETESFSKTKRNNIVDKH